MKHLIISIILILASICCLSQDTVRFKSSKQEWSFYDQYNIKHSIGKFEILIYRVEQERFLEVNSIDNPIDCKKYAIGQVMENSESNDSLLLGFTSRMTSPPFGAGHIRLLFVKDDLVKIGVLSEKMIIYYDLEAIIKENKL